MLEALIDGQRDPAQLAKLAKRHLRSSNRKVGLSKAPRTRASSPSMSLIPGTLPPSLADSLGTDRPRPRRLSARSDTTPANQSETR
jgi:hypothetical protein